MAVLLGEWGFAADDLTDSSGNVHDGTFAANGGAGELTYADGPLPSTRAVVFGHDNHSINVGRTGLEPATNGITVMGWMRIPVASSGSLIASLLSKARAAFSSRLRIGAQAISRNVTYAARWADDLQFADTAGTDVGVDQWHHLALVDGPTEWTVYLDGTQIAGGTRSVGAGVWEDFPWRIGHNPEMGDQWAADGMAVSMVRIFDGELTSAEVQTWMNTPVEVEFGPRPTIAEENALAGEDPAQVTIGGAGDPTNLGFARQFSVNSGETVEFSCHGSGAVLDIYRIGWYGGAGWRKVTTLINVATTQPDPVTVPDSNGGTTCTAWSVTASWAVPANAVSGLYVGVYRNAVLNNASYIPFIVRNDDRAAEVTYKTSDATWGLAYNYYGTPASPFTGKSVYGSGGAMGDITTRCHYVSYHRPIVTRDGIPQTYWLACEAPMIRWLERNGIDVKYVACVDTDRDFSTVTPGSIVMSSGHDEYWSQTMRDNHEAHRDAGGHLLFFSGNEVFWRVRYSEDHTGFWCFKDTMTGPGGHVAGTPLDMVSWTGTWKDTRWAQRQPEHTITGTDFRMNGVIDLPFNADGQAEYAARPFWRNTPVAEGTDTVINGIKGFEADQIIATRPAEQVAILAEEVTNIDGRYADNNGQNYNGNGSLNPWGIIAQAYDSGAIVVGFGTCQWSWGLDAVHDRGSNVESLVVQQATLNLFVDLGAVATTPQAGLIVSDPQQWFGVEAPAAGSGLQGWDGEFWDDLVLEEWSGTEWVPISITG